MAIPATIFGVAGVESVSVSACSFATGGGETAPAIANVAVATARLLFIVLRPHRAEQDHKNKPWETMRPITTSYLEVITYVIKPVRGV